MNPSNEEINRIREAYRLRDSSEISKEYNYYNPVFLFHMQEREREILKFLKSQHIDINSAKILEVGCGTGHILHRFLEFGASEAFGIDLMENRIVEGKKSYSNLNLMCGDASRLPWEDSTFDIVMQFTCFSSMLDQNLRQEVAREMWRVLKPGGVILSYDMRPISKVMCFLGKICREITGRDSDKKEPKTPIKELSIRDLRDLFPSGVLKYKTISLSPTLACLSDKFYFIVLILSNFPFLRTHYLALISKSQQLT